MTIAFLVAPDASAAVQTEWISRFARAQTGDVVVLQLGGDGSAHERLAAQVRTRLAPAEGEAETSDHAPAAAVDAVSAPTPTDLIAQLRNREVDLLVVLVTAAAGPAAQELSRDVLPHVTCRVAVVRLIDPVGDAPRFLVPASRSPQTRVALRLARDLARATGGSMTAVFVEPPIGIDAESVGRRALDRTLTSAIGSDHAEVEKLVVIDEDPALGIVRTYRERGHSALVVGSWFGGIGTGARRGLAQRLMREIPDAPCIATRDALPFRNRMRRWIEQGLHAVVPQLAREHRIELAERVQSNSAWNFDFVALISLSTLIAAMGLLQDSAAVVIGAMLVAPLMTPILGVGLALVQGNALLARHAFRAIGLGVVTAFTLAVLVGVIDRNFTAPSAEMLARGWPGVLDLFVAFVSGLAAAYASSRPSLFAALPGVAIAAALVPPIATSGLALSLGDGELAYGALLLFVTNMVAIILAAGLSLWAVGIRSVKGASRWTRVTGNVLITATLVLALHLSTRTPHRVREGPSKSCLDALHAVVADSHHIRHATLATEHEGPALVLRLGGQSPPSEELGRRLHAAAAPHFEHPIRLRITFDWEMAVDAAK